MSRYNIREIDEFGFQLIRKEGQVEMWHKPETSSYIVILYEHANQDEWQLLTKTVYNQDKADDIFDTVLDVLNG